VLKNGEMPFEPSIIDYGILLFRSEILRKEDFINRISDLNDSQFVSGQNIFKSPHKLNALEYFLPSNNEYGKWPGTLYDIGLNDAQLPMKELVHAKLPYFSSPIPPLRKFLDLPKLNDRDGRFGHVLLYIPNFKAQLAGVSLKKHRLEIQMRNAIPLDSLVLKINYSNDSENESETIFPKNPKELIELKFIPTALSILLLTQEGEQIDYQEDSLYHSFGVNSVLPKRVTPQVPRFTFGTPSIDVSEISTVRLSMNAKAHNGKKKTKKIFVSWSQQRSERSSCPFPGKFRTEADHTS
jgi:hypothetical protein